MAEKVISLLKEEQLPTLMHEAYIAAATEYSGVGDARNAQKYAALALTSGMVCRNHDNLNDEHRSMQALIDNPTNHTSWLFRLQK